MRRKTHQTIKKVTEDFDGGFHFNTAISAVMELVNEIYDAARKGAGGDDDDVVMKEAVEAVVLLLSPFVPHIAEEMWKMLGKKDSILKTPWPEYDKSALIQDVVTVVIQVNGKVRSKIEAPADIKEDKLKETALADPKVKSWIDGKTVKSVIVIPRKLVNIVV